MRSVFHATRCRATCATLLAGVGALFVLVPGGPLASQGAPQASGVIQGVVRNAADQAVLSGATLELASPGFNRRVRTDDDGTFRFGSIPAGKYRLLVMRVGYVPLRQDVDVGNASAEVNIELTSDAQYLSAVITRANVTAVYGGFGAMGSSNLRGERTLSAVAGATVQVLGSRKSTVTDSLGRYFVELPKAGRYMVRVSSKGLADQLMAVDVPLNKAVEVSGLLDSTRAPVPNSRKVLLREMDSRISWRSTGSALVSGAEVRAAGGSLSNALERTGDMVKHGLRLGSSTCVFVDGIARPNMPLDAIRPEEVEAIELYDARGDPTRSLDMAWPKSAPCGLANRTYRMARGVPVAMWAVIWTVR